MKYLIILFSCLASIGCKSQTLINKNLKKELEEILFKDQIYREFSDNEITEDRRNQIADLTHMSREYLQENIWNLIKTADAENIIRVEDILQQYGYPVKSLVGEPANTAVFYVIQHSDKIEKYYPMIEKAAVNGELPCKYAAMMLDRKLTGQSKPQVYGTQLGFRTITNSQTGAKENFIYVLPIEDPQNVNERRKKAGFDTTVEENTKRFGIEYKEYTYEQLNKIK
ncbi:MULTISPECIES: DUF6624 domain-containing protein [Flavobacterium]|uniref:DUF6624 domain-containing protein n=1 Tax=Flavobacterium TaxID=237 RepID=UPI00118284B7|nr:MULTISPECIES: DUF6624 domain-containing protein [Flavobacterium]MCR4032150.1 hypothetical protein [Flavobacterium panacis]